MHKIMMRNLNPTDQEHRDPLNRVYYGMHTFMTLASLNQSLR